MAKYTGNKYDFDFFDYAYDTLQRIPLANLRKDYSRLRAVAQKRLARLERSKQEYISESQFTRAWSRIGFPKLADIHNRSTLVKVLSDTMRFLSAKASLVTGQEDTRRRKIAQLRENGFNVNDSNFEQFIDYVTRQKEKKGDYYEIDGDNWQEDYESMILASAESDYD